MRFNSFEFVVLLVTTTTLFFNLNALPRLVLLLTASMVFYAFWSVPLLGLILIQAGVDFVAALLIQRSESVWWRRLFLLASLGMNLGLLGYFKYSNFFVANVTTLLGNPSTEKYLDIMLPPGISFYTFQSMSYTIDVYRRQITPTASFFRYFSYVMFFPQLVAGPIERASHLLTQLDLASTSRFSIENLVTGTRMILWGMFKKVMIADNCALIADQVYGGSGAFDGWSALVATYAFTLQIYCDFSAYSEIARGSARLFGVDLMINFDLPYLATNMSDFWRRWHISLSTWIRDYIYIPLGGNKRSVPRNVFNAIVTMFLSGLWHGAAWTFVLWGMYHGVLLTGRYFLGRVAVWRSFMSWAGPWGHAVAWFGTFHLVVGGWVLFRAKSLADAVRIVRSFGETIAAGALPNSDQSLFLAFVGVFLLGTYLGRKTDVFGRMHRSVTASTLFYGALTLIMLLYGREAGPQFIYFQF